MITQCNVSVSASGHMLDAPANAIDHTYAGFFSRSYNFLKYNKHNEMSLRVPHPK